ncbi:uncharacterized protein K02A2.6-like [Erpetoichthys calabaricus]|uniref:uncharacterized protein K02A2.6-like n=1 Tax=Erpetoichthys calabaricus TaxID=27687 RepID=UPI00223480F4|nr:uncharacterized protein K02A2.6-like [Erpetoichthys calabaricus]
MDMVLTGKSPNTLPELKPYLSRKSELSVQAGCLLWGRCVIIPPPLQKLLIQQLHASHVGIVRMKEIARSYFWWPGIDGHIEERAKTCSSCQKIRNAPQLAPLHPWDWPERAWQRIHVDFAGPFEEKMFLVVVDAYSKWPEVAVMHSTTAVKTMEKLEELFCRYGFPEQLVSDNGPQFVSQEFATFLQVNGIRHIRSAPYHPSTNGLAERFVQTMKHSLKALQNEGSLYTRLNQFLLSYRNSEHSTTKVSPAILMMKRQLHTIFDLLKPPETKQVLHHHQQKQIEHRDKKAKDRVFRPDDTVLARNFNNQSKWVPATVISQTGPVSYTVRTADGTVWRRHVDQLLQASPAPTEPPDVDCPELNYDGSENQCPITEEEVPPMEVSETPSPPVNEDESARKSTKSPSTISLSIDAHNERRYSARHRQPPNRLNL